MYTKLIYLIGLIPLILSAQLNLGSDELTKVKRTLVLLEDYNVVNTHSQFFSQIKAMGYIPEYKIISDDISLTYYGEYLYSNIIIMAPSTTVDSVKKSSISIADLLKYFDDGHDIMIFADKTSNNFVRKLVNEFGVDFDDYNSMVKDSLYLTLKKSEISQELQELRNDEYIISNNIVNIPVISKKVKGNLVYEGIGMDVDPANSYVFPILRGIPTTYSVNSETNDYFGNGERVKLVSAYQGRNNRRVVISGSMNLCSNQFYYLSNYDSENTDYIKSPNGIFCQDLLNWNFQRTGVLKYENIRHRRKSDGTTQETYRIKDELEYLIDIYEYDYINDSWKPYKTDDIQVEYVMLNPYYINQLRLIDPNKPTYHVEFKAPEKHGVFKFTIEYKRPGYSYIFTQTKAPLRPFNHNEFPRFLPCAYPYYLSVFISLVSFILFSILFLYGKNKVKDDLK